MKPLIWPLIILVFLITLGFSLFRPGSELPFKSLQKEGPFEVREYGPFIVAETIIPGERQAAFDQGVRILDSYINGGNAKSEKLEVAVPVTEQLSKKGWAIRFILKGERAAADFPKPDNSQVVVKLMDRKRFAVIRFDGVADDATIHEKLIELMDFVLAKKLTARNETIIALYSPPWTPGFLRKNELLLQLD
ncbi:SOUL family heme-binding protein [Estrella lausannensis]|uniref:Heme-binding protein n=1 Tax=Estrella lausannensis TaxID=483423 RepID=A0A0H5DND2_9BACT|nr:heme-binding protein [Estrella lausannensis]CRX37682.1 Heme-binding protein [Estrella lausannensis]